MPQLWRAVGSQIVPFRSAGRIEAPFEPATREPATLADSPGWKAGALPIELHPLAWAPGLEPGSPTFANSPGREPDGLLTSLLHAGSVAGFN
jgi:hypothetical protein